MSLFSPFKARVMFKAIFLRVTYVCSSFIEVSSVFKVCQKRMVIYVNEELIVHDNKFIFLYSIPQPEGLSVIVS